EVPGLELVHVLVAGPAAVVALLALGVQTPPAHPATQVVLFDAVEAIFRVRVQDAVAHLERGTGLLELLIGVQRLAFSQRPLALPSRGLGGTGCGHSKISFGGCASVEARLTGLLRRPQIRRQLDVQVGGSTGSSRTATAADAFEIDVTPRHERNALAGLGDGH